MKRIIILKGGNFGELYFWKISKGSLKTLMASSGISHDLEEKENKYIKPASWVETDSLGIDQWVLLLSCPYIRRQDFVPRWLTSVGHQDWPWTDTRLLFHYKAINSSTTRWTHTCSQTSPPTHTHTGVVSGGPEFPHTYS